MQSGRALVLSAPHQRGDAASLENTLRTIDASCERLAKTLETERACSPSPRASLIVPRPRREEHRGAGGADEGAPRGARLPAQRGGPDAHRAADSLAEAGHGARTEPCARVAAGGAPGACTFQWGGEAGKSLTYASCLSPASGAFRARWPSRTRRTRSCWRRRLRWARVSASKRAALSLSVARRTVSHHRAETRPRFQRRLPQVAGGQRREDPVRPCRTASEAGYRPLR